ncbi:MAG: hypothetical protein Q8903_04585 [Bacteroidota bacterium]|nr:hypothetical protein [Bacteroidota bacterium]
MDFLKQYIVQSISAASNSLRLNNQKIEVVALLREIILKSDDLEGDIKEMKKITEVSTFAIRLHEIYIYLTQSTLDFFKISEKFKDHSRYLIKDLSHLLDVASPQSINSTMEKLKKDKLKVSPEAEIEEKNTKFAPEISVDFSNRTSSYPDFTTVVDKEENIKEKESIIFEDETPAGDVIADYDTIILKPIKTLEPFLKTLSAGTINSTEIEQYVSTLKANAQLSETANFDVIANMHRIAAKTLSLIASRKIEPDKDVLESIRACLIVIVAVVKGKDVDITNYLNKAEEFGQKVLTIK